MAKWYRALETSAGDGAICVTTASVRIPLRDKNLSEKKLLLTLLGRLVDLIYAYTVVLINRLDI